MTKIAIAFSKPKSFPDPFVPLGEKRPVYEELAQRCQKIGWDFFIVSTKGYRRRGIFEWFWDIKAEKVLLRELEVKVDLIFDRSGGLGFPLKGDWVRVVDSREFKEMSWDKWLAYQKLGEFMPKTFWVGKKEGLKKVLSRVKGDFIVLKPHDGLKGLGVFIGPKEKAIDFNFLPGRNYLAQEFVETKNGISGITKKRHDLRVVVINGKIVWSHVRIPPEGSFKANVARGGHLKEVEVDKIPISVKEVTCKIAKKLYNRFDNPLYSLDFGLDLSGRPYLFEINDQIGFPRPWMRAKDKFLDELVSNFKSKL